MWFAQMPCVWSAALLWIRFDAGIRTRPAEAGIAERRGGRQEGASAAPRPSERLLSSGLRNSACSAAPLLLRMRPLLSLLPLLPQGSILFRLLEFR